MVARKERGSEAGFTLVGLMVAVIVVNIALGVAVTSVVTIDRRAREAETIFRGQAIAKGIACYRAAEQSAPESLAQLVEADCLRREYADPMSDDGQWRLLTEQELRDGTVAALLGQEPLEGEEDSSAPGFEGQESRGGLFGSSRQSTQQGVVGVTPGAAGDSLRHYNGRYRYEEWVFLAATGG